MNVLKTKYVLGRPAETNTTSENELVLGRFGPRILQDSQPFFLGKGFFFKPGVSNNQHNHKKALVCDPNTIFCLEKLGPGQSRFFELDFHVAIYGYTKRSLICKNQ